MKIKNDNISFHCFVCGAKLEEIGLGWLQCEEEKCRELFLPYLDQDNNQCLMLQPTHIKDDTKFRL